VLGYTANSSSSLPLTSSTAWAYELSDILALPSRKHIYFVNDE